MASVLLRLISVTLLLFSLATAVVSVENDELESMLNVLRARGYNLFGNAISTSDIIYEVIAGKAFTFFAPTDSSLYTLDMTITAADYVSALRCHVIPLRFVFVELQGVPPGSLLPTLAKNHRATIRSEYPSFEASSDEFITVDSVPVVLPDLFYSRNIAVHGLRGNLNCTPIQDWGRGNQASPSPRSSHVSSHSKARSNHAPPRPSNFASESGSNSSVNVVNPEAQSPSPAASLLDDHGFNSPVVSDGQAKPSPLHLSGHIHPPSSIDRSHRDFSSAEPDSPMGSGFPPSYSPAEAHLPPQVSPAYGLWLDSPTSTVFAPISTEPGSPPVFSENDDPTAFPPSATESLGDHTTTGSEFSSMEDNELPQIEEDEQKSEFSDRNPETTTDEGMEGIMGKPWEKCEPLDDDFFECTLLDELHHGRIPEGIPAYAYRRQLKFPKTRTSNW